MTTIYYLEDDENIAQLVREYLSGHGFHVSVYPTIAGAKEAFLRKRPTLTLVDWNMPDGNGRAFCRWVRDQWQELPVIFITVRGDADDIVSGFQNGADDYVVKPFELAVLYSRIQALLRRTRHNAGQSLSCGDISLDRERRQVYWKTEEVHLGPLEYDLLLTLLQNQGKTVTRQSLLEKLWDSNGNFVNDNTLTVTMKRLRDKLHQPRSLKTVRSVGYRMEEERS